MKIGNIDLGERPVMLAPMEDVTDQSFRLICREQGADMVYTEFVSADALVRSIDSTLRKLTILPGERPAAIQIYGRTVEAMVEAARIAEAAKPEVIDINFGCPVKKVAGKGAGAGMLRSMPAPLPLPAIFFTGQPQLMSMNSGRAVAAMRAASTIASTSRP